VRGRIGHNTELCSVPEHDASDDGRLVRSLLKHVRKGPRCERMPQTSCRKNGE
jgi:hypothetical protein